MGLTGNMKNFAGNVQQGAKTASTSLLQKFLRLITGFFVGVVLALIVQELTQTGTLILVFLTILFMLLLFRILRSFSILQIIIFQAFCILVANTLRMYIMMAP
jgi:uncharacterized membrane protein YoaK (UPF0700 family)